MHNFVLRYSDWQLQPCSHVEDEYPLYASVLGLKFFCILVNKVLLRCRVADKKHSLREN